MARKRLISPEFFLHGELYDAEAATGLPLRLAFVGLWCQADRRGYFAWKPRELKLRILPHDAVSMSDTMLALCRYGFIAYFRTEDGREFGAIPSFARWQTFNKKEYPNPQIPEPQGFSEPPRSDTVSAPSQHRTGMTSTGTGTGTGTKSSPDVPTAARRARTATASASSAPLADGWTNAAGQAADFIRDRCRTLIDPKRIAKDANLAAKQYPRAVVEAALLEYDAHRVSAGKPFTFAYFVADLPAIVRLLDKPEGHPERDGYRMGRPLP